MIREIIEKKLYSIFQPDFLEIDNESHHHRTNLGAESHFRVVIVSEAFVNQSIIARHRAVYLTLNDELKDSIHALALHTYTPQEWFERKKQAPISPACRGNNAVIAKK